jgi:hypothetical protein
MTTTTATMATKDDPTVLRLLLQLRDDREAAPGTCPVGLVLADWLEERGDVRAADVRHLAEARPVVPPPPGYWRPREGLWREYALLEPCEADTPNAVAQPYPMACGRWWVIHRAPRGVSAAIHPGTPEAEWAYRVWPDVGAPWRHIDPALQDEDRLLLAFDDIRGQLVGMLLGAELGTLRPCAACGRGYDLSDYYEDGAGEWETEGGRCVPCGRSARQADAPA